MTDGDTTREGGLFSKDSQPKKENRKPRGKHKRTLMLEAVRATCETGEESEFLQKIVKAAMGDPFADTPIPPNTQLMTLVLQRIEPPLKPTAQCIKFDFANKGTPAERALSIIESVASGELPVDTGQVLIGIIKDTVVIEESTELKERIAKLEELIGG